MIGTADVKRLAGYYTALFGPHDEVSGTNTSPGRLIWNVESTDFRADYDRLVAAGAIVVKEPYDPMGNGSDMRIATFADPDGNYFQLMTPMSMD
jgi:predicted enzyme related to lactoylglutathione lyase